MKAKVSKNATSDGYACLTKRILLNRARAAGKRAAAEAMEEMGYVVVAENEWIVRKYKDGHIEKISPVRKDVRRNEIRLD